MAGVYIHIPFCKSKCPYCDFYSYCAKEDDRKAYVTALIDEIKNLSRCGEFIEKPFKADTLYLGGGTPSVLSGEQLFEIISIAKEKFGLDSDSEITVECNPGSDIEGILPYLVKAGVNRVSLGLQSAVDLERKNLGRISTNERVRRVIQLFKDNGISNISLDIMLGVPYQTSESLEKTLDFVVNSGITHVSSYILKIEENTFFHKNYDRYEFPDEDAVCDLYLKCFERLKKEGFKHYEISNAALPGYESRHNSKYWLLEDYLGIGPGAHSFVNGKRFYFPGDTESFIKGNKALFDCIGGDCDEYIMLSLRLSSGLSLTTLKEKYGKEPVEKIKAKIPFLKEKGLLYLEGDTLSLTESGFLLSNNIIAELI